MWKGIYQKTDFYFKNPEPEKIEIDPKIKMKNIKQKWKKIWRNRKKSQEDLSKLELIRKKFKIYNNKTRNIKKKEII